MARMMLFTAGDGFDYVCRPRRNGGWHCGKCQRGVLHSWDKKCRVCKHPVIKRPVAALENQLK